MAMAYTSKLLQRPLVEIRRGFVLGYAPPTETSAVIALTAPSGKFVDIRVPRETHSPAKTVMPSAYNLGPNVYATSGVLTSTAVPTPARPDRDAPAGCLVHSTWTHHIDSSGATGSTDGADMLLLANGEILEVGVLDVKDGKGVQMFKEFWVYPEVKGWPYIVVETAARDEEEAKGMVVRIGPYCQGVLQTPEQFWLERWRGREGEDGAWTRDACSATGRKMDTGTEGENSENSKTRKNRDIRETEEKMEGTFPLPCRWACEDNRKLGQEMELAGRLWRVTEIGP